MTPERFEYLKNKGWKTDDEAKELIDEFMAISALEKLAALKAIEEAQKNAKPVIDPEKIRVPQAEARDIRDAYEMAEDFDQHKSGDSYILKEGYDIFYIIHSLVMLWRRCLALENFLKQLDKKK